MKIDIPQFRKHSLSLALLAALGLSGSVSMAQEPAMQPVGAAPPATAPDARAAAEANARAAAQYASRLERLAREAAREAQEAARVAANLRAQGAATQHGADTAKATSYTARQAAIAAQEARNEAIESAHHARAGRTVAADGVNPAEGVVDAQASAWQTEQAARAAVDAATRANEAAAATATATMPPASDADTSQQGAQQRSEPSPRGPQTVAGPGAARSDAVEQVVIQRGGQSDVVVTSRPNLLPEDQDTGMVGDYELSGDYSISFSDIDQNGDGFISREEARVNPGLGEEFSAADQDNDGMLSPAELQDWAR